MDKKYRLAMGWLWCENEQPSDEIKAYVEKQLAGCNYQVDIILSHTVSYRYEPREVFIPGLDQSAVDKSTEKWLDEIETKLDYKKWYCGHYHTSKKIDRIQFMFKDIDVLNV